MDRPTAADVRLWAATGDPAAPRVDLVALGYPVADPDSLERPVALATAYVERMTGRTLDASLPADLVAIAEEAVLLATVQQLAGDRGGLLKAAGVTTTTGIKSFRAGDYSQENFGPEDFRKAGLVNPWARLSELLLLLATPEQREELIAQLGGQPAPAMFAVERGEWSGYGYGDW